MLNLHLLEIILDAVRKHFQSYGISKYWALKAHVECQTMETRSLTMMKNELTVLKQDILAGSRDDIMDWIGICGIHHHLKQVR